VAFESTQSFGNNGDNNFTFDVFVAGDAPALVGPRSVTVEIGQSAAGLDFGHYFLLPGDASGDGYVDSEDSAILAAHWGQTVSGAALHGDFNNDGVVNSIDASILSAHWHTAIAQDPPGEGAAATGNASDDSAAASTIVDAGTISSTATDVQSSIVGPMLRQSIARRTLLAARTRADR
jgi:hypothetical protein